MKLANYSAITGMVLVLVVIFGFIAFYGFNEVLFQVASPSELRSRQYSDAKYFFSYLLTCHGQGILREEILEDTDNCNELIRGHVVGYKVHQETYMGCEEKEWEKEAVSDHNVVYRTSIENKDGKICIGQLIIYVD